MASSPCGVVMLDLVGLELSDVEIELLQRPQVGGVILFSRNYESPEQLEALNKHIKSLRPNLVIAADQEGGRVQRFKDGFTRIPPMAVFGRLHDQGFDDLALESLVGDVAWLLSSELRSVGVDISFAPVLDVDDSFSRVIGDRAFASDPMLVARLARAFVEGMHEAGVAATGKHFPGHGGIAEDTHLEKAIDRRPFEQVKARDLVPFEALTPFLDGVMPAHVIFEQVAAEPVGFSAQWLVDILRKQLNFKGVVFSDDLSMAGAAYAGDYIERAKLALSAGCNTILICNQPLEAEKVVEFLAQNGEYSHESGLERMLKWQQLQDSNVLSMTELHNTQRWLETRAKLTELEEKFGIYSK